MVHAHREMVFEFIINYICNHSGPDGSPDICEVAPKNVCSRLDGKQERMLRDPNFSEIAGLL